MKTKSLLWIFGLTLAVAGANAQNLPQRPCAIRGPLLLSDLRAAPEAAPPAAAFVPASVGTNAGLRREVFLNIPGATLMKAGVGDDNLGVAWHRPALAAPTNGAPPIGSPTLALTPPATSLPTSGIRHSSFPSSAS